MKLKFYWQLLNQSIKMSPKRKIQRKLLIANILLISIIISAFAIGYQGQAEDYQDINLVIPKTEKEKAVKIYTPEQAKQRIVEIAKERNFKKTDLLLKVINCESKFNQFSYNVNKGGSVDRGIAMWNDYFHSRMTNEQAFDVDYSINKMMDYFDQNKEHLWTCYKIVNLTK